MNLNLLTICSCEGECMAARIKRQLMILLSSTLVLVPLMGATAAADPTITEYPTPTSNSLPYGVTPGPDGNVWFTEANSHNIGRITPIGTITEFPLPTTDTSLTSITSGPDGNLWFTEVGYPSRVGRSTTG